MPRPSKTWTPIELTPEAAAAVGPGVAAYQRDLSDGHLTVLVSANDDGRWHMSISHRRDSKSGPVPGRNPTWTEIRDARYLFMPPELTVAMLLPPKEEYVNLHGTTFHLWEVKTSE